MVEIKGLYKRFGDLVLFENFQVIIDKPRHCIQSPNGSGKSTLLCMIAGIIPFDNGEIRFSGSHVRYIKTEISIASDSITFPGFITAKDVLELTQSSFKCQWPEKHITQLDFTPQLSKQVSALSAGSLKKLQLINAMMRDPKLLLLDEPNIALDNKSVEVFWEMLLNFNGQIIVASNEAQLFEQHGFPVHDLFGID